MKKISNFFESNIRGTIVKCVLLLVVFLIGLSIPSPFFHKEKGQVTLSDEKLSDTIDMVLENGVYTGSVVKGTKIRHGYGTFRMNEGAVYEGEWRNDALPYGMKTTKYSVYTGKFDEELKNQGFGIIEYNDKYIKRKQIQGISNEEIVTQYIGNWEKDNKSGLGRAIMNDGSMQFGMYSAGLLESVAGAQYRVGDCVYGIDASHWQHDIDWDQLAIYCDENGKSVLSVSSYIQPIFFVYLKATEGATQKDDMFNVRKIEAERHGIVRGAYHFLHLGSPVDKQIKNFLETVKWTHGDLPPALDVEVEKEIKKYGEKKLRAMVLEWLQKVEREVGVKPIIYTNEYIRNKYLQDERLKEYDIWISKYSDPPQGYDWQFWQITDKGKIKGYDGDMDINIFNGNYSAFMNFVNR